jgi:hypothetical protein
MFFKDNDGIEEGFSSFILVSFLLLLSSVEKMSLSSVEKKFLEAILGVLTFF